MKKRAQVSGVQMYSFLDAMICTVGALLVLLHAFAEHGQVEAVRKAEAKAAQEAGEDPRIELELVTWRIDQLREMRTKTEAQLSDERLKLAHVEDHERRLREKIKELKIALDELDGLHETGAAGRLRDLAALEAARVRLVEARDAVERARQRGKQAASYSVVPYEGPNSTRRRPIYIECRQDLMILQPEGVELTPRDFAGSLGPGNPLASALRGTREHFAERATPEEAASEPYPLLLVRPDGIGTYYVARTALDSWGSDFGYELIDSDWELTFSEPDVRLAELLRQIVVDARHRMRELMAATGALNSRRPRMTLHASSSGGFVAEGGPGRSANGGRGWDSLDSSWARGGYGPRDDDGGKSVGANATAGADPHSGGDDGGSLRDDAGNGHREFATDRYANETHGAGQGNSPYDRAVRGGSNGTPSQGASGSARYGERYGQLDGQERGPGGDSAGEQTAKRGTNPDGSESGSQDDQFAAQSGDQPGRRETSVQNTIGGTAGDGGGSQAPQSSAGTPPSSFGHEKRGKATQSLATVRGRDWGLPGAGNDMTPITRPIAVECRNDRLVILPEDRGQPPNVTRLDDDARGNIDEFVSGVWRHMKGWGMAGRGLYWRPTLLMSVEPGAADRYAEVKALLADSGLDVRERPAPSRPRTTTRPANSRPNWTHQ